MRAEIINTGTELFFDEIANINLAYLSNRLIEIGWEPVFHTTVPDKIDYLIDAINAALKRVRLLIITGGLGPTSDDITRFAIALATRRELKFNNQAYKSVKRFFDKRKVGVHPINRIQAEIPKGAKVLDNSIGTAPGFILNVGNNKIVALPGVPRELKCIFDNQVRRVISRGDKKHPNLVSDKFLLFGISEAHLQEHINNLDLSDRIRPAVTAANNGVISLRFFAEAKPKTEKIFDRTLSMAKGCLGKTVFGKGEDTIESVVGNLLIKRNLTLSVAESCTGGLISRRLSKVPGISDVLQEGLVCYSNKSKTKRLGITLSKIKRYGAVSEEIARLMARNIAKAEKTHFGIGVTGIAGPSGGTKDNPVGTVYIAIHSLKDRTRDEVLRYHFLGPRIIVQERAAVTALNLLRLRLLKN